MKNNYKTNIWVIVLLSLSLLSLGFKIPPLLEYIDDFKTEQMFNVSATYYFEKEERPFTFSVVVPENNRRQRIASLKTTETTRFQENANTGLMELSSRQKGDPGYSFTFKGKSRKFRIKKNFQIANTGKSGEIKSDATIDRTIIKKANELSSKRSSSKAKLDALYNYVVAIPNSASDLRMDAVRTMSDSSGNSIGKSELFAALARNIGIPARIRSGMVLSEGNSKNLLYWTELRIEDEWVPFDVTNDHYAYIPANYLQFGTDGTTSAGLLHGGAQDISYQVNQQIAIPYLNLDTHQFKEKFPVSLWGLIENGVIGIWLLSLILMIPVGGLIVAFLRNVVGLKTFGVFLPVLIAFSLIEIGFWQGLLSFVFLIIIVGLATRPLSNLALMHTPKMVISLTIMVLVMLLGTNIGMIAQLQWLTALSFFPVIILTISAERFSSLIDEEGFVDALSRFGQTLISVLVCYFLLYNPIVPYIIILFPETLLLVIVFALILGKYIGLRWSELFRFKPLLIFKN